jgi:hypothetical protein
VATPQTQLTLQQQLQLEQQIRAGTPQDSLISVNELNRQTAFLSADQNRINQLFKRAAAVVRTRYLQIVRPAIPLGRLLRIPFCGGPTGRGVLVPGPVSGHGVVSIDSRAYPGFENCSFIFETFARDPDAPLDVENQTAIYADIRVNLGFDSVLGMQPPSAARAQSQPVTRWDVELTSEPYVFQALPNLPPPVTLSTHRITQKPNWPSLADLDSIEDSRDFGFENRGEQGLSNRLEIARRAIEGHEGGIAQLRSVAEDPRQATSTFDPCGETRPLKMPFLGQGQLNLLEDRCYTYQARVVAFGDQRADRKYQGQLRIRFQKDARTGKIIGVRAFSFGGNI